MDIGQLSFADEELVRKDLRTAKRRYVEEMGRAIPWAGLQELVEPHYYDGQNGRPPYPLPLMLRIYFLQISYSFSDRQVQEELHEVPVFREFVGLSLRDAIPDETTILRFRRLMERHQLGQQMREWVVRRLGELGLFMKAGTVVDATIIEAPRSTKNQARKRDPEMSSTKKGDQWYFGIKTHIGMDVATGTVHKVVTTTAKAPDVKQVKDLLHGEEREVYGDAGYRGAERHMPSGTDPPTWHIAMGRKERRAIQQRLAERDCPADRARLAAEKRKASTRAMVEHVFRIVKRQFGFTRLRYRGLQKNANHLEALFTLANIFKHREFLAAAA